MKARGYTLSDDPDLLINVSARLEDKTKVTTYNDPYPAGYYGYRRGYYDPWYGYGYGTQTHVSQYTEGTINIDMVDARAKRMVWEGVGVGRLKENRTNEQVRQAISDGVDVCRRTDSRRSRGGEVFRSGARFTEFDLDPRQVEMGVADRDGVATEGRQLPARLRPQLDREQEGLARLASSPCPPSAGDGGCPVSSAYITQPKE